MSQTNKDINWNDPRAVARWAATLVHKEMYPSKALWMRKTFDGLGFILTDNMSTPPRSGLWTYVATIDAKDADQIHQRGPQGWPALHRLSKKIEEATECKS